MKFNWIDRLGDWNPQLLRELKGRFKTRNVAIASVISLVGQVLLLMSLYGQLPVETSHYRELNPYCTGRNEYSDRYECVIDLAGNFIINWQHWWLDVFTWVSVFGIFTLLVVGTYMLIADLAQEERRDTLNFIRLSPQSTQSILFGKLLGVPILLYLVALLAVPLHLGSGIAAHIPLMGILGFYGIIAVSCLFFYSLALLFGLISSWLAGFQPWLASGLVLQALYIASFKPIQQDASDWVNIFSPALIMHYLVTAAARGFKTSFPYMDIDRWQWFYIPVGASFAGAACLAVLNYGLWTYGIWQCLMRRFPNPSKTMLSKHQSYLLVAGVEFVLLGFALQPSRWGNGTRQWSYNLNWVLFFELVFFLCLIAALLPHRQALQDWARYRREKVSTGKNFWKSSLVKDLIWGEKSPAIVAIALNLAITSLPLICWILLWPAEAAKGRALASVVLTVNVILIYGAIAQLMLLMKAQKQAFWATAALGTALFLPPLVFAVLSLGSGRDPYSLWLISGLPWVALTGYAPVGTTTAFLAILGQFSVLVLCNLRLTRQLKQAGESASKALLAGR